MIVFLVVGVLVNQVSSHGHIALPDSTRHGGSVQTGGDCTKGQCFWFSNNVEIPGKPTLPNEFRSLQLDVVGSPQDVYVTSPWRAPGLAPVYGSGCGSAGGGPVAFANGGYPPQGIKQGLDGLELPKHGTAPTWTRGTAVEVAWAISANHGGGYSWRLCKSDGNVTEKCFQQNQLKFSGDTSWLLYADGSKKAFKTTKVTNGTYPAGSEWARDPIPGCYECDAYQSCGTPLTPVPGYEKSKWDEQVNCYAACDGSTSSKSSGACPDKVQFPEPLPGISGFGKIVWDWSVMDLVEIPENIEPGEYLLGWRWDCEESTQVWENCADVIIK